MCIACGIFRCVFSHSGRILLKREGGSQNLFRRDGPYIEV